MTKKQSVAVGNCASIHGSRRRTRRRRRITSAACFSLLGVVPASVLRAATDTWIGVSSSWDNTGNWSGGAAPNPTTYTTAVFGAYSSQSQPFVTQPETFSILQFSAGGWDISGTGTLDLSSITSTGSNTVAVTIVPRTGSIALTENAGTLTINSPVLPGTGSLSIAGSGTIVLNASSTAAGTIAFTTPVATTLVAGSQTAFGNDTLAFSTGSFNPNLVNASSGTIQIAAFSMPSVTSGTINFNSSTGNGFNVGGTVTLPSSSTLTLVPDTATLSLGSITASTSAILDLDGTTAGNTITGSITNGISLNKTNTSTWTLAGSSNNYYGATTVQAGTLVFATPGTFGPGNETLYYGMPVGSISVGGNATLSIQVNGEPDATTQTLSYNAGTLALGTGTLTNLDIGPLSGGTGTNKTIQLPTLSAAGSATLNITSANNYGLSFGSWTNASGTLNIAGTSGITFGLGVASLSSGGSLTLASTTANFSIGSVSTSTSAILDLDGTTAGNTITGSITNGISLNKTNTSTWTLAGSSNNYYGATTVQAGTLVFATPGTFGPGNETLYYGMPVGSISVGGNATLSIQVNGEPDATTQTLSYNAGTLALGTGTLTNLDIGPLSGGTGTNKTIQLPTLSAAGSATLNITSANNYGLSFGSWTNASGTLNIAGTSGITFGLGVASLSSGGSLTLASTTANFSIGSVSTSTSAILDLDGTTAGNTITGSITNGISLNKTNTSTWTLAGSSNNYYGATTVQAGTLVFATPGTFGPGNETLYYGMPVGSISVGGNATLSIQVNGEPDATTQTLSYNAGTLALGTGTLTNLDIGPLSGGTGTNKTIQLPTLSAAGSATLNITSANNYGLSFGSWTNASGTLNIAGTSGITFGLGVASLSSGGSLTLASTTANFSIGSVSTSTSAILDLDGTTAGNTITGSITNGISLNKTNTSTWTLAGSSNNYYGATTVQAGTLVFATPGTFGPGNETLYYGMPVGSISVGGNATLSIQVNGEPDATTQTLSYNAGTLALGTGTLTNLDIGPLSGGTGTNKTIQLPTLSAAGSATLNITSANNYGLSFGSWTNASGTLNIAGTSGITFGLGVASLSSGGSLTLASTTANFSIGSVSTSTSAILDLDGTTAGNTITGSITNGISLNKTNTSTWTLAGSSNNYYGATTVQAGTLVFATPGTFGPGNETLYYGMPVGSISVGGNATLSIQVNGEPDATTQTLSYNAGTLALGTGTLTNLDIGPLSGGTGTNKTIQLPTLSAAGSATLNITSANNYGLSFGSWTNASGTLNIAGTSGITFGLGVASLSSGGSLTLASTTANFSIGSVSTSTSAILDLDGTTAGNTITGSITNGISLNKTNTSTWTLAGSSNNYYGATTVQAGTLVFATPGTFGPGNETLYYGMPVGSISVGGNATLSIQVNGEPDATTQTLSYNAGTLALGTGTLTNLDIGPLSGGTGTNKTIQLPTLSAAGSATLNITSANNYGLSFGSWTNASGTLNIAGTSGITFGLGVASLSSGGSLTLASNTANFSIGSITASGSATLDLDGTTTGNTITGSITNGIYLNKTNTSTWTLAGATNNYYGGTNISGGTLIIAGGLSVGSITQVGGTFVDAGTLAIASGGGNATGYTLNGGTLSAGTILVSNGGFNFNNGTVNLTNSNLAVTSGGLFGNSITLGSNKAINVSGTTTITGGTVNLGGGQLASGSIVVGTGGSLNWTSGTVSLTNSDLSVTAGSLLGATISLTSQNQEALNVSGTTNIASDGAVIVNGGTFTTGSINIASGGTFEYVTGAVSVANNPTFIATLIANNNGVVASGQSFGTTASFTPQTPTTTVVGSLAVGALNIPASNSVVDQGTVTAASLTGSGAFQLGQQATLNLTSTTVPLTVAMGQPVGSNFSVPTSSTVSSPGGITVGTTSGTSATFSSTGTVNTTMLTLQPNAMANFSGGTGYANTIVQSSGGSGALNFSGPVAFTNGGGAVVTNLFINNGASFSVLDQLPPFGEDPELNRALVAGYLSNGIITLGASGVLSSPYLKLGISSGETGTFTQTAGSASLSILCAGCDGTLTTGQGTGIANISGGTLYANTVLLGSTAGGSGAMTVSGSANVTVAGSAHINDLTVNGGSFTVLNQNSPITEDPELYRCIIGGYLTSGALNVGSTGFVSAPYIKLGITSGKTGTFNQTGGTVDVGTLTLGSDTVQSSGSGIGQATISGGTLSVGTLLIGSTAGGVGTLAISASANVTASVVSNGGAIAFSGGTSIIGQGNGTGTGAGGASTTGGFTGTGTLNVTGGSLTAATIRQATLNVGNGASVAIADSTLPAAVGLSVSSNTAATSVLTDLLFNGANFTTSATGSVDLKNNDMIINDASQHAYLISAIAHAYDNGNWDMSGITSSSAAANHTVYGLGYATGAELGTTSFDGQPITSGSTVVKYTLLGDTTLKGAVTGGDYSTVVANFGKTGQDWSQGNFFNVTSGPSVTGSDYSTVVANFGKTASGNVVSAMASPALTRAVTPDVQQGSVNDMHLEVNTSTGDVQLLAETTMTLSLYAVYDSSSNLRTGQWHKLSTGTATASTGVTYTPANWAVAGNSSGALGEGQNQGAYNSTIPSTFDNISLAAGQTIDLGNIFKTTTNSHTLSFEFQEPNASTGDPVNGYQDFLNGTTIDYIGGSTPEPSTLGILALGGVMMLVRRRRTPAKVTAIAWNKIKGDE